MEDRMRLNLTKADTTLARFWAKVNKDTPNGCWEWQGALYRNGYGQCHFVRESYAHRVAWTLCNDKPIPQGMVVCHKCDNRKCVNPAHLFVGTQLDNIRDMDAKGRGNRHKPEPKLVCPQGHVKDGPNLYIDPSGHLRCKECRRAHNRKARGRVQS